MDAGATPEKHRDQMSLRCWCNSTSGEAKDWGIFHVIRGTWEGQLCIHMLDRYAPNAVEMLCQPVTVLLRVAAGLFVLVALQTMPDYQLMQPDPIGTCYVTIC